MDSNSVLLQFDALHNLSYEGQLDEIISIQFVEKLVNEKNWEGCTPLHYACAQNHTKVAKHLISLGAEVNCQDKNLSTAVHWAAFNNNIELVKILIERNANVRSQDSNGIHPIHLAALKGHVEMFNILKSFYITCGEISDNLGITPLHLAAHCGHHDIIQALINNKNFDLNAIDKNDITPLHLALASNYDKSAKLLLRNTSVSYCYDSYDRLLIHWAAVTGNVEVIKYLNLVSSPLKQNHLDKFKCTPLFLATIYGHDEAVNILLQNNYQLNLESGQREMYLTLTNLQGPDGVINKYYNDLVSLPNTLHWAAAFCSKNVYKRLLDNGANIEERGLNANTPLHTAASFGNKDVVELLIERGAQLNPLDNSGSTPLHWAVAHCHIESIECLLDKGASKKNALCWVAACGNLNIIKLLIESRCNINEDDGDEEYARTPLMWAATCGHAEIIEYLLREEEAEITNSDILHWCVVNELLETIKMLIDRGIDVNEPDINFKRTALHWAAIVGNINVINYLLSIDGIDVNACDGERLDNLPIHHAIDKNHYEIVKILIKYGSTIDKIGDLGLPVLMAVKTGKLENVKIFVESGADIESCCYDPETLIEYGSPLRVATSLGYMDIAEYLLGKNFEKKIFIHYLAEYRTKADLIQYMKPEDVNAVDYLERTPLFYAILGHIDIVKFLIENGANVNHKSEFNETPLYVAIEKGKFDCVRILIKNGADVNIKMCTQGITPLMVAIKNSKLDIMKFLIENCKADINILDNDLWSPLHHAADISGNDERKLEIIDYLLSRNVDVNAINCRGLTPFHLTILSLYKINFLFFDFIENEHSGQIIQLLLDNGAEINKKTCSGNTPLSATVREKDDEHIKLLILHGADVNLDTNIIKYCTTKKDISILQLLQNAGLHFNNIRLYDRDKFDSDVQSFITCAETNPLDLKQLCRISFRNTFDKHYLKIVKSLYVPHKVKQYLLFDQL